MLPRITTLVLAGTLATVACGRESPPQTQVDGQPGAQPGAPATAISSLFVEAPAADAQLVFVGADASVMPADRGDAVFVPFSTFSVERDGVPNEFPPADSLATLLQAAGVHGDRFVIIADPIPAGRAYAAFDWLGLGDRAALLDGGRSAVASLPSPTQPAQTTQAAQTAQAGADTGRPLQTRVRDDMIVDAAWVHDRLNDDSYAIIDARPPAEFSGATPGDGIDRPGHIPGARNLFWQDLVESADNPRLKDEAELRSLFQAAGAEPGRTVVAYCRTGGQAAFLYTVARHLGYDVRMYDGSFIDWSRTPYPVER
jgi:thiosulfate/3-mercaptopyruvate sulfurtransferase